MALVTMTWGVNSLPGPDPRGITVRESPLSASRRALGGRLWVDVIDTVKQIEVRWPVLDETDYATVRAAYESLRYTPSTLTLPDSRVFNNVICTGTVWADSSFYEKGMLPRYSVTLVFEETLE